MKLARPSGLRFAFAMAALVLGFGAQAVLSAGSIRWAIAPYVVAAVAMALAVADRPLVFGTLGRQFDLATVIGAARQLMEPHPHWTYRFCPWMF